MDSFSRSGSSKMLGFVFLDSICFKISLLQTFSLKGPSKPFFFIFFFRLTIILVFAGSVWQSTIPMEISRVNQVDAARLNIEMLAMLKEQLVKVLSLMKLKSCRQLHPRIEVFMNIHWELTGI